jgi:hypothetical protein
VLAASGVAAVATAPAASGARGRRFQQRPHRAFRNNARLVPDSVVISGTVFPRAGVNLSVGQKPPYATNCPLRLQHRPRRVVDHDAAGLDDAYGGSGLPWAPATDGLRNIAGHVNGDGTVTIYATTSTQRQR